jgi:hypothetical protein
MFGRMPFLARASIACGAVIVVVTMPVGSGAGTGRSNPCIAAADRAARESNVPFPVLLAISQTETGRAVQGKTEPWPWSLNVEGRSYWHADQLQALRHAQELIAADQALFDVGCFQINYRWHGQHFATLADMLDPDINAAYAADFLSNLYAETGNWSEAAGAYHSRTSGLAARYRQRFDAFYAAARGLPKQDLPRTNAFPLLQAGLGQTGLGSLVPLLNEGDQ